MSLSGVAVRTKFACTSRAGATKTVAREMERTLAMAEVLGPKLSARGHEVPAMPGVDEDMRGWSLHQILEHNAIVNEQIRQVVESLHGGRPLVSDFDAKHDTIPSFAPGEGAVVRFRDSVAAHLRMVEGLGQLRGTVRQRHPLFGFLDAHGWHCMFGFHLFLHRRQAEKLGRLLRARTS